MNLFDEIAFWSRQLSEHALFLNLGLVDPARQARALVLHQAWEQFRQDLTRMNPNTILAARDRALRLAADLRGLKVDVAATQATGKWLGWLFPSFVDHTRRELDYFVGKVTGVVTDPNEESCTWLQFMAEHAGFAAHLLDPEEQELVGQANQLAAQFASLGNDCQTSSLSSLVQLSTFAGRQLDAYFKHSGIGTARVKSVVHPVLADHVVREGIRFLQTMQSLGSSNGGA